MTKEKIFCARNIKFPRWFSQISSFVFRQGKQEAILPHKAHFNPFCFNLEFVMKNPLAITGRIRQTVLKLKYHGFWAK
jgi:hypothetical protein